jgi:hypothetical protein
MKNNLLNLFINKLYNKLKSENLGFKTVYFSNGYEYIISDLINSDIIDYNHKFLLDNLKDYFFNLIKNHQDFLPIIFHDLIIEYPEILFTQLSSFPIFGKFRKGLDDCFHYLDSIFNHEDLSIYLQNYIDKQFICSNYYSFERMLNEINKRFKFHNNYEKIILHNLKIHSKLIKKTNGNKIATRSWCIKNLNNIYNFEEFITFKEDKKLFHKIEYFTTLIFINIETIELKYILNNVNGFNSSYIYKNFIKSLISILNSNLIKTLLNIERVEGQLIFDNQKYQLTFFSKKELNSLIIEEDIEILLNGICEYYNKNDKNNKKSDDFEDFVLKFFQIQKLNKKLNEKFIPLNKKSEKVTKI